MIWEKMDLMFVVAVVVVVVVVVVEIEMLCWVRRLLKKIDSDLG